MYQRRIVDGYLDRWTGTDAYIRDDSIAVIPFGLLGP